MDSHWRGSWARGTDAGYLVVDLTDRCDGANVSDKIEDIRVRLDTIGEELADLAIDVLRQAVDEGAQQRPPIEKTLTKARRAVAKAARILDEAD